MTTVICGSRLGRGLVVPGGVAYDLDDALLQDLHKRLDTAECDLMPVLAQFFEAQSVRARLVSTGPVSQQTARDLGLVGLAARASGVSIDSRSDHAAGWYLNAPVPVAACDSGDIFARAHIRRMEIERSISFARSQFISLPHGPVRIFCPPPAPGRLALAITEGWRGEVVHVAVTSDNGAFARYKIIDPSFHNWAGLAIAL